MIGISHMLKSHDYRAPHYCHTSARQHGGIPPSLLRQHRSNAVSEALLGREVESSLYHVKVDLASRARFTMLQLSKQGLGVPSGR